MSPFIAGGVAAAGTFFVYRFARAVKDHKRDQGFRWGQIGSASLVSLAHGTGDAQKTMGVIALALIANGTLTVQSIEDNGLPVWITCGVAIAAGTYLGGWRIIRTLGKGLVDIESPQGMAAESSSAASILTSSHFGMALSTTHVATGSILGSGVGRPGASVRWHIEGRMGAAWLTTLPAAGVVGAVCFWLAQLLGGLAGVLVAFAVLVGLSWYMWLRSQRQKVDHSNVNADWDDTTLAPQSVTKTKAGV